MKPQSFFILMCLTLCIWSCDVHYAPIQASLTCDEGAELRDGDCVFIEPSIECGEGTREENGACVPTQERPCGPGTFEENGACLPIIECPEETFEENGECVPNPAPPLPDEIFEVDGLGYDLPYGDLARFGDIVGDAPVVALGESIHTSGGYSRAKVRLFQYLVEERGFRAFAFETSRTAAERVEDYVATCQGEASDAMQGLFAVWGNKAVQDLLEWMCAYNQAHPEDPVFFFGFDTQQPWDDGNELRVFLEESVPDRAHDLIADMAPCHGFQYASADAYFEEEAYTEYTLEDFEACTEALTRVEALFEEERDALIATTSAETVAWGQVAFASLEAYHRQIYYDVTLADTQKASETRDEVMAYIFQSVRALRYQDTKTVIWAHNTHIARANEETVTQYGWTFRNMGSWLNASLGREYVPIALNGYDVSINWPSVGVGFLPAPSPGSVEGILHAFDRPYLIVDLRNPSETSTFPRGESFGLGNDEIVPHMQYDGIFFLEKSPKMQSIFW